jgi:hypothetical protein
LCVNLLCLCAKFNNRFITLNYLEKAFCTRKNFLVTVVLLAILTLAMTMDMQTVSAVTFQNVQTWYWTGETDIDSVSRGDVDDDGKTEVVTGGSYNDGTRNVAQLCVWNGATLALENVKTWYWTGNTGISSVDLGDVDADGKTEVVTGGSYNDGTRDVAQLCIWEGATLSLERVKTWYWIGSTTISYVVVEDVDGDGKTEIVTGGGYSDCAPEVAQLCVWNGATLALKNVRTWYWVNAAFISSVAVEDVDSDGQTEIITGGIYIDGDHNVAQLCVWNGASMALENVKTWYWPSQTNIQTIAVGDADNDGKIEIVTGGFYAGATGYVAQLCVWNGATLALENVKTWYWTSNTYIWSVALGDADNDGKTEIATGGIYLDGDRWIAQLCVWSGSKLGLKNVQTWYWSTWYTDIWSIVVGDVDSDGKTEIVTGGNYYDGTRSVAQLCVWA